MSIITHSWLKYSVGRKGRYEYDLTAIVIVGIVRVMMHISTTAPSTHMLDWNMRCLRNPSHHHTLRRAVIVSSATVPHVSHVFSVKLGRLNRNVFRIRKLVILRLTITGFAMRPVVNCGSGHDRW